MDFPQQTSISRGISEVDGTKTSFIWGRKRVLARARSGLIIMGALTVTILEMATSIQLAYIPFSHEDLVKIQAAARNFQATA